jgi:AcrR family transcriptional regulator
MPRPRKDQAQDTRTLALTTANAMLHEHGYLGVSMDDIAKKVGVSKAALYHHFPEGKEQLVLEIAEYEIAKDTLGIEAAIQTGKTTRKKLENIATFVFTQHRQTSRILRDAMRFMPSEHQQRIYGMFYEQHYKKILDVIQKGVRQKEFRRHDTERSSWAFMGLLSEMNSPEPNLDKKELATFVVDLLIKGLHA